ncbi:hypothetical protein Tco_0537928 [Tanacetum coccineum]
MMPEGHRESGTKRRFKEIWQYYSGGRWWGALRFNHFDSNRQHKYVFVSFDDGMVPLKSMPQTSKILTNLDSQLALFTVRLSSFLLKDMELMFSLVLGIDLHYGEHLQGSEIDFNDGQTGTTGDLLFLDGGDKFVENFETRSSHVEDRIEGGSFSCQIPGCPPRGKIGKA